MSDHRTILVFLKYPEPGRVKTRLAAILGAEQAAALYREWIGRVLGKLQPLRGGVRVVGFFDSGPAERFAEWAHLVDDWQAQPGGSLGERLEMGFAVAHRAGGPVLAVGTDCLELEADLVAEGFARLRDRDAVFGPASDGGYYLVGTARHLPGFFNGIRWSSEHTLADHLARCRECDWSVGMLPLRHDIDTGDDWRAYLARQRGRPSLAVVLPALNEEARLAITVRSLLSQTEPAERLLVVDGGSRDGTEGVARSLGAQVLSVVGRGRGGQIAAGVEQVSEEVVLVAHADMLFPPGALAAVRDHLIRTPNCPGGCLGHRFDSARRIFRLMEWFDRRRARRGMSYGDQVQFFRREALLSVGGFPDQPIMEDVELSRRLRSLGRPVYLDLPVVVSPRRFEQRGVVRAVLANWFYRLAYRWRGQAACQSIYRGYHDAPR